MIAREVRELYQFRWVTFSVVTSTLRTRYKRSVLGFFWSLLGPILNYLVVAIIFSFMLKNRIPNYFVYMFAGTAIFNLLSATIAAGPSIMLVNESFIKKIYLPKFIFVINLVLLEGINFLFGLSALLILGLSSGLLEFHLSYIFLPLPILCALFFNVGIAAILSTVTVFFRDVSHLLPIVMQCAFFGTPILYTEDVLPPHLRDLLFLNPFYYFVEAFRWPIYHGAIPPVDISLGMIGISLFVFLCGFWTLKRYENKIVFRL